MSDAVQVGDHRDDGPVCLLLGGTARGRLPPLPAALAAAGVTALLLAAGARGSPVPALLAPFVAVLLAGPSAGHPHTGRLDWLVPPIIRAIEYGYLAVLGFAQGVSAPVVYVPAAVLALHHCDVAYRSRRGVRPRGLALRAGLGWEGRMLWVAFAGLCGLLPLAYAALAAYLGVLFGGEGVATWARSRRGGLMVDWEEEKA
ncbi:DUF5941 domain-containing protein [Actinomadura violacea]|uniref:DUF5941 domain-containing protein n=1 Tax=Actinomadura violacea TaxID=2819934 RepID=A0ABS3S1F4_9ACTN|nr:DUF5941 domain-containing protein [Actinomadura violacea]MBO2462839.1 hypothetical protein [Actinomadura violacea]